MKKLLSLTLALVFSLSLTACGGTAATGESSKPGNSTDMVTITTEQGVSMLLPSELTVQENHTYLNSKTGDNAVFDVSDIGDSPLSSWKEADVLAIYQSKYPDAAVKSFENGKQIGGKEALVAKVAMTSKQGNAVTANLIMLTDGKQNYIVALTYGTDTKDSSLSKNLQACIDSIKIQSK